MKKIINGKRYNTNAPTVGVRIYGKPGEIDYIREEMHIKKTGEFFIYLCDNDGEKIVVISIKKARDWVKKYLDDVVYNRYFGRVDENSTERGDFFANSPLATLPSFGA